MATYRFAACDGREARGDGMAAAVAALARMPLGGLAVLSALFGIALLPTGRQGGGMAARSRVGAKSKAQVRRVLIKLARDAWHVRHAVDWSVGGALDM